MVPGKKWDGLLAVQECLATHASALISLGQELELSGDGHERLIGRLYAYHPEKNEIEFRSREDWESFFVNISNIHSITVLSPTDMTPRIAMAQMKEMERCLGK